MMPVLGALILQAAYGAVDLLVVGRYGSTSGAFRCINRKSGIELGYICGNTARDGNYRIDRAVSGRETSGTDGIVIGGSAVVFARNIDRIVYFDGHAHPISVLMQAPEEAVALTANYVRICGGGIFFIVAYNVLSAIFKVGDSKSPLLFVLVACIINIIGDLALVAGLHMDAVGAAIATVAAQGCSVVFAIVILLKKDLPFSITKKDFRSNVQCNRFLRLDYRWHSRSYLLRFHFWHYVHLSTVLVWKHLQVMELRARS